MPRFVDPNSDTIQYSSKQFAADLQCYREDIKTKKFDDATVLRNTMIQRVRLEIDANYHQFEKKLFDDRAYFATGADWVELGLAGATTVIGGEGTKTILGAVLTATKGARLSLDKNFFREKTTETMLAAMQAERLKKWTLITQKMTAGDASQYSWDEAWADLLDYFYAGTIENALLSIAGQTGAEASDAKKENRDTEKDRVAGFTLQKASKEVILNVRQLTRMRIELEKTNNTAAARAILDSLGVQYTPEDIFKVLRAQIDALKADDTDSLKKMTAAFRQALNQ